MAETLVKLGRNRTDLRRPPSSIRRDFWRDDSRILTVLFRDAPPLAARVRSRLARPFHSTQRVAPKFCISEEWPVGNFYHMAMEDCTTTLPGALAGWAQRRDDPVAGSSRGKATTRSCDVGAPRASRSREPVSIHHGADRPRRNDAAPPAIDTAHVTLHDPYKGGHRSDDSRSTTRDAQKIDGKQPLRCGQSALAAPRNRQ